MTNAERRGFSLRPFLTRQWAGALIATILLSLFCYQAGMWQLHRHQAKTAANDIVDANFESAPMAFEGSPADDLVGDEILADEDAWTPLKVHGTYLVNQTTIVRNRPLDKTPGVRVLVPFRMDNGQTLVVDRGWIPNALYESPDYEVPQPAQGDVSVVVRLRPSEPLDDRDPPPGQGYSITPSALLDASQGDVVSGAYGLAYDESPQSAQRPQPTPRPQRDDGPHLSYSMQWFTFALGSFVGLIIIAQRSDSWTAARGGQPSGTKVANNKSRRPTDEEIEDAIVSGEISS